MLRWAGNNSAKALAGLMLATAVLSAIIDDLVLVLMMLPFAYKILDQNETPWGGKSALAKALVLGVAFSSYIGGYITPVGSVVNVLAMGFAEQALGVTVTFANWMVLGTVTAVVMLPITWFALVQDTQARADQRRGPRSHRGGARRASRVHQGTRSGACLVVLGAIGSSGSPAPGSPPWTSSWSASSPSACSSCPRSSASPSKRYCDESPWQVVMLNWAVGCVVAGMLATGSMSWLVGAVFGPMSGLPLIAVLLIVAVFACVFHNILPAGAAVAGLITIPVCTLVAGMGGNVTAAIFLCAVFSCAAFLLPLDLCVYCAYSSERKYFTPFDEMKVGWVPSVVAIAMVALVIPGVCTLMGLQ